MRGQITSSNYVVSTREITLSDIVSSFDLQAGLTKEKDLFIPLSVDYLSWSQKISAIFHNFKTKAGCTPKRLWGLTSFLRLALADLAAYSPRRR